MNGPMNVKLIFFYLSHGNEDHLLLNYNSLATIPPQNIIVNLIHCHLFFTHTHTHKYYWSVRNRYAPQKFLLLKGR